MTLDTLYTDVLTVLRVWLMFLGVLSLLGYSWNGLVNFPQVLRSNRKG